MTRAKAADRHGAEPIAIIGMRARVPGADDLDRFWRNLADGVESITPLDAEDILAAGVPESVMSLPGYVNAAPLLGDVDRFDAAFFGFSARDAALTDPQQRIFLETAWESLEDAGYDPATYPGPIGTFGGCEMSTYLYQLFQNPDALGYIDGMQLMVTNDKDHLCTQVSYRLDLRGPSVVVQTTCSTSLVAVALACESLRSHRCDMALAGGVTVRVPQRGGYYYVAGSILSPDGHCRPFDANAQGTIVGSGVGMVVLKRLSDAIADGDGIRATILGYGLNNDGRDKVGYTAPGIRGQVSAIADAYRNAGVSPESVGYVEAHGTGTILGDPIELSALTEVFRSYTSRRGFCGIGSAKSNFGHLSCASGVVGLIKAVLSLEHGAIPPTVHYRAPNPAIDFLSSPFFVTNALHPWDRNGGPRRAAVSSFGVGGTNAHAVLQEPPQCKQPVDCRPHQILTLSARSKDALDEAARRLGNHFTRHPELHLADAAFTLHVGRRAFRYRRSCVVRVDDRAAAVSELMTPREAPERECATTQPAVVFMFPGQGSQYPSMAQGLYRAEPIVKNAIDECCRLLKPDLGLDLRRILFPAERRRTSAAAKLRDTALAQPALFVVEYAIAQLWRSWGIEPTAMIGHSIGEYVAATLAGVMAVEDALRLIASRGRLISALPSGSMLAVVAPTDAVDKFLDDDVCLAAVNAPSLCVLSGSHTAIERVERALATKSIAAHRLHTSHAFHSSMMEPMLAEFGSQVADTPFAAPTIPYVATLTGAWADGDARQPDYWTSQIRSPVRFADGISALTDAGGPVGGDAVFVEVGPGRTLVTFAARCNDAISPTRLVTSLPAAEDPTPDTEVISSSLGRLWESGITVDWKGFHVTERRYRVSLPTYPFERQSYWIGRANRPSAEPPAEPRDPADWFFEPLWRETAIPDTETGKLTGSPVLVFDDRAGMGSAVADALSAVGALPIMVRRGDRFECVSDDDYRLDPAQEAGFSELAAAVCARHQLAGVVNCWGAEPPSEVEVTDAALTTFLTPLRLAVALGSHTTARPLPILLVARGTASVLDGDMLDPPRSFGIGAAKVLPQEQAGLRLSHIDVDDMTSAPSLIAELALQAPESQVAYRQGRRFVYAYEPRPIAESRPPAGVPSNPVVMVTGGLGYMGLILAEAAFFGLGARLVLMGRTQLPPPQEWAATSEDLTVPEAQRTLLRRLAVMRAERDDVMVTRTDLADVAQVRTAVDAAVERFGRVDIVVHGAANVGPAAFGSTADTDDSVVAAQISPKITGLLNLIEAMRGREPGRWIVHGSISAILGGLGLAAYAGANAVLNTMVEKGRRSGRDWLSIEWDAWDNAGESQALALQTAVIRPQEGQEAFLRILGTSACPRIVVAANDLEGRIESWIRLVKVPGSSDGGKHPRPNLSTAYIEPRTETERELAEIWSAQLGVENVGVHDRFFDLGGHSLLAVQVSAEIRDHFGVEMPVLQLFKAPTISELAPLVENPSGDASLPGTEARRDAEVKQDMPAVVERDGDSGAAAKVSYQQFYDDITRRLEATGMGEASFFLNYGYVSLDDADEAQFAVSDEAFNANSIRLAYELIGHTELAAKSVVDVGCGRGGTAALLAERFGAAVTGVDLSPEAIAFCRKTHIHPTLHFTTGDAEHLPTDDNSCDVVTNIESSHTYPDMRAFLAEVGRVLRPSGMFLHTDLLPVQRWLEVRAILQAQGFVVESERDITANVLASCDDVAGSRTVAFGEQNTMIDNFLAVPGSPVYEQMRSGAWEYRILRSRLTS